MEDAEVTSGLEPPSTTEGGKAGHACINGRRVEVLSRTINVLKKLLKARRGSLAAAGVGVGAAFEEEEPVSHSLGSATAAFGQEGAASAAAPAVFDFPGGDSAASASLTSLAANAAAEATGAAGGAHAQETRVAAAEAANPQAVVHHMPMPMSGHHASLMMPPGFAGMPGHHGMPPGQQGQPIFFAVPMYMPQGQGMPPSSSAVEGAESAPQALAAAAAPSLPAAPAALPRSATAANPPAPAVVVAETKEAVSMTPPGKAAWAMPAGMGFQHMALQMPQFVTQALSSKEGDEKPTHAVCA